MIIINKVEGNPELHNFTLRINSFRNSLKFLLKLILICIINKSQIL